MRIRNFSAEDKDKIAKAGNLLKNMNIIIDDVTGLNEQYYVELGNSIIGNKNRLANFFAKFDNQLTAISKRIDKLNDKKKELGEQLKYSSQIAERIEHLEKELAEIFDRISMKN